MQEDDSVTPAVKDTIGHSTALLDEAKELYFTKDEGEKPLTAEKLAALKAKHPAFRHAVEARQALLDGGVPSTQCPRITQEHVCNRDACSRSRQTSSCARLGRILCRVIVMGESNTVCYRV